MVTLASVLASYVWHYWLSVPLFVGVLLTMIALLVGYLRGVTRHRYPPGE